MTAVHPALSPRRKHPCSVELGRLLPPVELGRLLPPVELLAVAGGHAADLEAYAQSHPRPLFRDWLIHNSGQKEDK